MAASFTVEMERQVGTWQADVVLDDGKNRVAVEVITPVTDAATRQDEQAFDANHEFLDQIAREHDMHWEGFVPAYLNQRDCGCWRGQVKDAACKVRSTGEQVSLVNPNGEVLVARPGTPPVGTTLSGPLLQLDAGARLVARVLVKAAQVASCDGAWVWMEDHGALRLAFGYHVLDLEQKAAALARLVAPVLDDYPTMGGFVFTQHVPTNGQGDLTAALSDDRVLAFRKNLSFGHGRETVLVASPDTRPPAPLVEVVEREVELLETALRASGLRVGFQGLFTD